MALVEGEGASRLAVLLVLCPLVLGYTLVVESWEY